MTARQRYLAAALGLGLIAATPGKVPEPPGLWQGPMRGYTPNTVQGATVIDAAALAKLIDGGRPVLIDVALADRKPPAMAPNAPWLPLHRSIPGAIWMPGAGDGSGDPQFIEAFKARIAALTGGDLGRPIVTFCHPECWGSWNTAKRLAGLGYTHVYWFPEGVEGWQTDHETMPVKADAAWAATSFAGPTQ